MINSTPHQKMLARLYASKSSKYVTIATTILLVMTLVVSIIVINPSSPHAVHAAGATISISPTHGPYTNRNDQQPIMVSGKNFGIYEKIAVFWNYTGPGTGTQVANTTADGTGKFTTAFIYQLGPTAVYTIAAIGQVSQVVATGTFDLLPQLYIRPQAGGPGTPTTFYGNAFGAGETVKVYWMYSPTRKKGPLLATATGDANGSFTVNGIIPTNYAPGNYNIGGVGQTSMAVGKYQFTIYTPTVMLAPRSGSAGATVTVTAYGFTGGESVSIYWNNQTTPLTTAVTSPYGYLAPTAIKVPTGTVPGAYPISVVGQSSMLSISNTYTIIPPSSSLDITQGPVGSSVKVTLQGYAPHETALIYWNNTTGKALAQAQVDSSGAGRTSITIPAATAQAYQVIVVGKTSQVSTQNTFTIANSLAAYPTSDSPGLSVTANGTGYQGGESVLVYWDTTTGTPLAAATADSQGNIKMAVTVPASATPGAHSIIGVGQTSQLSLTAPVTVNTNWSDFGFDLAHHRENTYENILGTSNVANLQVKWRVPTAVGLKDSPVYANGTIYIATMDGMLDAYDALTGAVKWRFKCQCIFRNFSSPLVDANNGLVFFGTVGYADNGIPSPFYSLDAQTGKLLWSEILPWHQLGFPTVAFNTLYVGTSHLDHGACSLFALDEFTGRVVWQYVTPPGVWGAVGVDINTHMVFTGLGDPNSAVVALDAGTGKVAWLTPIPQYGMDDDVGSAITVSNSLVYADSKNGSEFALNEQTGAIVWTTPVGGQSNGNISSQAVSANGNLYVGSISGYLYALNATTGALVWKTETNGHLFSSPAVANGVVYIATIDQTLLALDANTGTILWTYKMGGTSFSSPIVVNGWVYCGSTNGKLYAFSL